jgi:hypothetical protein
VTYRFVAYVSIATCVGAAGSHVQVRVAAQASTTATSTAYVPPRTPDGQPRIQGVWQSAGGSYSLEDLELQVIYQQNQRDESRRGKSRIVDPPTGKIPYQTWAAALAKKYFDAHTDPPSPQLLDPVARCIVHGVPRAMFQEEYEIFQSPGYVAFVHAPVHQYRIVPLDGRPALGKDIQLYMGDSRGRWDGNTLVIESSNYTNKTWLDIVGSFHTDAVRFTERLTPVSPDRIDYQVTVEDPKAYTRPWTIAAVLSRIPEEGREVWEQACHEGERDTQLMLRR